MALKAGYKGIKEVGPGLDYDNTTGLLSLDGESSLKLDNLEDVNIDTPLGGDVLQYDSSNEEWTNETPDTEPVEDSPELITSGAVYEGLKTLDDKISAIWSSNARTGVHQLLDYNLASIKANNTTGTWNDNVYTIDNVTVTVNSDLSITLSANSPSATVFIPLQAYATKKAGKYAMSGATGGSNSTYAMQIRDYSQGSLAIEYDGRQEFEVSSTSTIYATGIRVASGSTFSNVTIKPLITVPEDTDTSITPYAMTNGELTEKVRLNVIATAEANQTYSAQMSALYTAFQNMTDEQKKRSIVINGNHIYHIGDISTASYNFASVALVSEVYTVTERYIRLSNQLMMTVTITNQGVTTEQGAGSTNTNPLILATIVG